VRSYHLRDYYWTVYSQVLTTLTAWNTPLISDGEYRYPLRDNIIQPVMGKIPGFPLYIPPCMSMSLAYQSRVSVAVSGWMISICMDQIHCQVLTFILHSRWMVCTNQQQVCHFAITYTIYRWIIRCVIGYYIYIAHFFMYFADLTRIELMASNGSLLPAGQNIIKDSRGCTISHCDITFKSIVCLILANRWVDKLNPEKCWDELGKWRLWKRTGRKGTCKKWYIINYLYKISMIMPT